MVLNEGDEDFSSQIKYAKLNHSCTILRSPCPSVCVATQGRVLEHPVAFFTRINFFLE